MNEEVREIIEIKKKTNRKEVIENVNICAYHMLSRKTDNWRQKDKNHDVPCRGHGKGQNDDLSHIL